MNRGARIVTVLAAAVVVGAAAYYGAASRPLGVSLDAAPSVVDPLSSNVDSAVAEPSPLEAMQEPLDEESQKAVEAEVEAEAIAQLKSLDPSLRAEAAAQLATSQSPRSAKELARALRGDPAAVVREAAAQTLVLFHKPPKPVWEALLAGLEDARPKVQAASMDTLQALLMEYEDNASPTVRRVRQALKTAMRSPKLSGETKESLQALLDQFEAMDAS